MLPSNSFKSDRGQRPGAQEDPRLNWWREARFGMFIHWGLYAIPAGVWQGVKIPGIGEWIQQRARIPVAEYETLAARFNPVKFNAAEWVSLAKRAGQKYLVITAKHHDGFCLFKTALSSYNIVDATPFGRDVIAELAQECARQGIRFGLYYSQTQDWHHPDGAMAQHPDESEEEWAAREARKDFAGYINDYVKPQVTELLTHYGPIGVIWFDTPMYIQAEQSLGLLELVHHLQPDCLVCGRVGNALGDYASAGDNRIPGQTVAQDWETPATMNDTWGY
jgi:alpha-L-fucosidase